jgi:hypothetical protein
MAACDRLKDYIRLEVRKHARRERSRIVWRDDRANRATQDESLTPA